MPEVFAQRLVLLVERATGRYEQQQAAGTDFLQRRRKEVIVNDKVPFVETRVVGFVVAEGDVRDRHVIKPIGEFGFLERLMPDVRIRIKQLRQPRRHRINLDAGDLRTSVHRLRHQPDEMTEATGGFQNASVLETKALQRCIHRADEDRGGVVRVERGGASGLQFFWRQQCLKLFPLGFPFLVRFIEHLRQSAPADVTNQNSPFIVGGSSTVGFTSFEQLDGGEIVPALLLQ